MQATHAIVLIPGLDPQIRDHYRDQLVQGLVHATESASVAVAGEAGMAGAKGVRLEIHRGGADARLVDVYEAHWGDLVPHGSQGTPVARMGEGLRLLAYWFSPRMAGAFRHSRFLTLSLLLSALALVAWYYGVLALGLTAIGSAPPIDPEQAPAAARSFAWLGELGAAMGGWYVWAVVAGLMGFLPVDRLVDMAAFTRGYLLNEPTAEGPGIRDRIRNRVLATMGDVAAGGYAGITVVAHSFGSVIAVDVFGDHQGDERAALRLVTMGTPLRVLCHRSAWLRAELDKCLGNRALASWQDYYSDEDWLCGPVPGHEGQGHVVSRRLVREAPLGAKLSGATHKMYYGEQAVVEDLVQAALR